MSGDFETRKKNIKPYQSPAILSEFGNDGLRLARLEVGLAAKDAEIKELRAEIESLKLVIENLLVDIKYLSR